MRLDWRLVGAPLAAGLLLTAWASHRAFERQAMPEMADVFFQQALAWMDKQRKGRAPFFAYIPLNAAHAPLRVPDGYFKRYEGKVPENTAKFYGMIENLDDNFSALLNKLKNWRMEDNTLVIFLTDNGGTVGVNVYNAGW